MSLGSMVDSIFGGGGGGGGQTTSTTNTSNIPEYARPYVENMLGATQNQLFNIDSSGNITGFKPYQAYGGTYATAGQQVMDAQGNPVMNPDGTPKTYQGGEQLSYDPSKAIAGFSPLQTQAQQGIAGMQVPGEYGAAKGVTSAGIMNAANMAANATPQDFQNQVGGYMNPYMQQVLAPQMAELRRQAGISGVAQQGAATQAGAFGGSREAIMAAENERNLMNAQNQAIGQAYGNAFNQAQNQYNQSGAFQLQANQAAMQNAGQLAGLGQQELAAQQGIYGLQNQTGAQQQALQQATINQAMTDYANAQQYPLMQLGTMSNMLRGLPMQASTTNQYAAAPSALSQGIGAAGAYAGLQKAGVLGGASGGTPKEFKLKKMAAGGITSVPHYDIGGAVYADLEKMSPEELQDEVKNSSSQRVKQMAQNLLREKQVVKAAGGGIIAFKKGDKVEAEDAAAAPLADESMDGIMLAKADTKNPAGGILGNATSGVLPNAARTPTPDDFAVGAQKDLEAQRAVANKSIEDIMAERQAVRQKLGVDTDTAREDYRAQEMARRANLKDEAERQRGMRLAEFFASWGSTPGSTLVAGMTALKKSIPGMVEDTKEAKKLERESDKIIYDIDQAIRLEKLGRIDEAMAIKDKAAQRAEQINKDLLHLQGLRETNAAHIKAAEISSAGHVNAAKIGAKFKENQDYARILGLESKARNDLETAKKNQNLAPWLTIIDRAKADPSAVDPKTLELAQSTVDRAMGDKAEKLKSILAEKSRLSKVLGYDVETAPATPAAAPAALPEGLPQGSKQVGTSGGKPVYEDSKGKRYIVQ